MTVNFKKVFYSLWIFLLSYTFLAVINITPKLNFFHPLNLINIFQRITGLWLFIMISFQIPIGALMGKLTKKFGQWVFKFHLIQCALITSLVILHPISYLIYIFVATQKLDPFYIYTDFCVLCETKKDLFLTFGRLTFWLISTAILAAILRKNINWKKYWRGFHKLNYFIFPLLALHGYFVGQDLSHPQFVWIFTLGVVGYLLVVVSKIDFWLKQNIRR